MTTYRHETMLRRHFGFAAGPRAETSGRAWLIAAIVLAIIAVLAVAAGVRP